MTTTTFTVEGMSCDHCVRAVTNEVSGVAGVTGVDVDLASGRLTVTSEGAVDATAVRAAVDEAGYTAEPADGASASEPGGDGARAKRAGAQPPDWTVVS